jgi:guanylate kinase
MSWLLDFFKAAFFWVLKNPILIVLVIIIAVFNQFFSNVGIDMRSVDLLHPDSIWALTLRVLAFAFAPVGFGLIALSLFAAAAITMFNTAATLAVFSGEKSAWRAGFSALLSGRTLMLFLCTGLINLAFGLAFLFGAWLTVPVGNQHGMLGSAIIILSTAVAYPVFYMLTSVIALIMAAPVSLSERLRITRTLFLIPKNLKRILAFYLIRIGAEALAVGLVLLLIRSAHLPSALSAGLLILAVSIPFALVRTTGLVMKLEMLRDAPWFSAYFANYYDAPARGRVHARMTRGRLILVMGPTGSGKGTLVRHARELHPELALSVSCTTRTPRAGEVDGVSYHFLTRDAFMEKADAGEFLEWAEYGGNLYGTLRSEVEGRLERGISVILEIEVQGVRLVKERTSPDDLRVIFIDAGSWEALEARIRARAAISDDEVEKRRQRYSDEESFKAEADAVILNEDGKLEEAEAAFVAAIERFMARI